MPTVLRLDGLQIVIYPNDHRPANVHVKSAEHEAVFLLHCPAGPAAVRENFGFRERSLRMIAMKLTVQVSGLCDEWSSIHGYA